MKGDPETDPKGLIEEAFRIEGISDPECRTIFLDWALSLPTDSDTGPVLRKLIDRYGGDHPDHPMTAVLRAGLGAIAAPRRRGGWRGRSRS